MTESHSRSASSRFALRSRYLQVRSRRNASLLMGGLAVTVALAGCAAGADTPTIGQRPSVDGVSADYGTIGIRAAAISAPPNGISYAKGDNANLQVVIVNSGTASDTLDSVSTNSATSITIGQIGKPVLTTEIPIKPSASTTSAASSSGSANSSSSASGSGAGTSPSSESATGSAGPSTTTAPIIPTDKPIVIPANSSVQVGYSATAPSIYLLGLTSPIFPGATSIPVTFTFTSGATIQANLPVQQPANQAPAPSIDIAPAE